MTSNSVSYTHLDVYKRQVGYANSIPKEDPNKENLVNQKRESLYNEFQPLLDKLEHYANVLKEKED